MTKFLDIVCINDGTSTDKVNLVKKQMGKKKKVLEEKATLASFSQCDSYDPLSIAKKS